MRVYIEDQELKIIALAISKLETFITRFDDTGFYILDEVSDYRYVTLISFVNGEFTNNLTILQDYEAKALMRFEILCFLEFLTVYSSDLNINSVSGYLADNCYWEETSSLHEPDEPKQITIDDAIYQEAIDLKLL